jgi:hypothetical protein
VTILYAEIALLVGNSQPEITFSWRYINSNRERRKNEFVERKKDRKKERRDRMIGTMPGQHCVSISGRFREIYTLCAFSTC